MNRTALGQYDFQIRPQDENANQGYLITFIYPVREGIAIMLTNSFGVIPCVQWLVFERYMVLLDDKVHTRLSLIDKRDHLSEAMGAARVFAYAVYGRDITGQDVPF